MLGFNYRDQSDTDLHRWGVMESSRMSFMYDRAYGPRCVNGQTKGLIPYYKLLNQLFRNTLTPRSGDADNISQMTKSILFQMSPKKGTFSVSQFIWNEIINCSFDAKIGCHYAPYVFHVIQTKVQMTILADKSHIAYCNTLKISF